MAEADMLARRTYLPGRRLAAALIAAACAHASWAALPQDVELDNASAVRSEIEAGRATPDTRVPGAGYAEPAIPILALAARAGSVEVVRLLIASRADLNARTPVGETALMLASLVADAEGEPGTPVTHAHFTIVRALVEAGAALENPGQLTAVSYAAHAGHLDILRYLLDRGASPDGGATGEEHPVPTPLAMAVRQGKVDAARLLLERGANPRIRTPAGDDALALARKLNQAELVPLLECAVGVGSGARFAVACAGR
jgi:purine nucleoside permease